jgi:thymidylate synthase
MALPPCHLLFQFFLDNNKLSCQIYQRSCDFFLGVPFNIASYALLTHMVAAVNEHEVGRLIWVGGDTHIYDNHRKQVGIQMGRAPKPLPFLTINKWRNNIEEFEMDDFELHGYNSHSHIPAPIAV